MNWHTAVTTWTSAPIIDVLAAIALAGYLIAVRRRSRQRTAPSGASRITAPSGASQITAPSGASQRQPGWSLRAAASWLAGVVVLLISVHSSIEVYGHALLWVHMLQHLLLIMVVPVLLIWGLPTHLDWRQAPGGCLARWLTFPGLTLGLYTGVLVLTHLTGFPELMATQSWAQHLEQLLYLLSGYLLFWPLVGSATSPWSIPHIVRFALLGLAMGADTLVGVALMLTGHPLAPSTALMRPGWGPSLLEDQSLSGAIMWVGGDSLMMLLMLAVIAQWSATGSRARLGDWLESARRQSLASIGSVSGSAQNTSAQNTQAQNTLGASPDVDDDEAARQAYNRMLAALHRRSPPGPDDG